MDGGSPQCESTPEDIAKRCTEQSEIADHVYFHAIFDFVRYSSLPLMVKQVCAVLNKCVRPANFRVILHSVDAIKKDIKSAANFLTKNKISFLLWRSRFDTVSAQIARLRVLNDVNREDQLILQSDIDEFPDLSHMQTMVELLLKRDSQCDVFSGTLWDRMPLSGELQNVSLTQSITDKFPLRCEIKKVLERAASKKIIMYRAVFRPEVGNHRLFCQRSYNAAECELRRLRVPSSHQYPNITRVPRQCSSRMAPVLIGNSEKSPLLRPGHDIQKSGFGRVDKPSEPEYSIPIDHYKYVYGLKNYLETRVSVFKQKKIAWYKESQYLLDHIEVHDGKICVTCPEVNCMKVE